MEATCSSWDEVEKFCATYSPKGFSLYYARKGKILQKWNGFTKSCKEWKNDTFQLKHQIVFSDANTIFDTKLSVNDIFNLKDENAIPYLMERGYLAFHDIQ